jgi:hypothetical protein
MGPTGTPRSAMGGRPLTVRKAEWSIADYGEKYSRHLLRGSVSAKDFATF